jgi:septum formation protein
MPLWLDPNPLILASRSTARRAMLMAAGIPVEMSPADIDERSVESRAGPLDASQAAVLLAREKARSAGAQFSNRFVVGADQTLALGNRRFAKPGTHAAVRDQLRALAGRTHELHSAVAVARDGRVVFSHVDTARLTMRAISDRFIDSYLDAVGADVLSSVGGYQFEKFGVHLFERIEGDHFTILGMPLIPLLAFLRREGSLAS